MTELLSLYLDRAGLPAERGWQLLEWCHGHGADQFTVNFVHSVKDPDAAYRSFDEATAPYKLVPAVRRVLQPDRNGRVEREVQLWTLTPESIAALRSWLPKGILYCYVPSDAWLEDLILYRAGVLMLAVISHEGEGVLRVGQSDRDELLGLGYVFESDGNWVRY